MLSQQPAHWHNLASAPRLLPFQQPECSLMPWLYLQQCSVCEAVEVH